MESSYRQSQLFLEIFLVVCGSFFRTVRILGNVVEFDDRPSAEIDFMQSFENGGSGHTSFAPTTQNDCRITGRAFCECCCVICLTRKALITRISLCFLGYTA